MEDEEQPLLSSFMQHVDPVADDESFVLRRPSRLSDTWRQARHLDSPVSNWFLYPIFWLSLWIILLLKGFQDVFYRAPCKLCRKRSGTVDQLTTSSDNGCQDCALYAEVLKTMASQIEPDLGIFTIKPKSWFKKFPLVLTAWNVGGFETGTFRFLTPQVCKEGTATYPRSFNVSQDSGSDECLDFALRKVEDCVKNHKKCRKPKRPALPRRVVDVCSFEMYSDVKLYETHGTRGKYIALSHTWGRKHTFMTNTSNLAQRKQSISLASLPKTFRDAICLARMLRIRYVWIDSLCIIQDNLTDWEEESPKMGAVYGNAYLTIAAGSALNDQSGFLGPRSDFTYRDFPLKTKLGNCASIIRVQDVMSPDRRDPLSFRAWAFQERLLSRRTLYYHQQELVFECKQGLKCECMSCSRVEKHRQDNESTYLERLGVNHVSRSFPRVEIPTSANIEDIRRFWRSFIVPEYSARSITRDSDRLPALSSVASAVCVLTNDRYVAGMWHLALPADLAWTSVHNARSGAGERVLATLPSSYVAPSWCWASVNGPVEYRNSGKRENLTYRVSVLEAECPSISSNPFGAVDSGYVILRGNVIYGTCELQVEPDKLWPYRIKLLFPTPDLVTLGFEPDVAFLAESDTPDSQDSLSHTTPESWLATCKTLRRENLPVIPGNESSSASNQDLWGAPDQSLSYGRITCLLLYTVLETARSEWIFMVLGQSGLDSSVHERLGMLTCWVNGCEQWPELDAVRPAVVTIV